MTSSGAKFLARLFGVLAMYHDALTGVLRRSSTGPGPLVFLAGLVLLLTVRRFDRSVGQAGLRDVSQFGRSWGPLRYINMPG